MTLIEKIQLDEINVSFYNGIDIDFATSHPKDGSSGFIFFFFRCTYLESFGLVFEYYSA